MRCRAGEEITISYGSWSSEVFYLFFGFLPPDNPWDSVTLFSNLSEMIAYHDSLEVSHRCACMNTHQHLAAQNNGKCRRPAKIRYQ